MDKNLVLQTILERRSVRKYGDTPLTKDQISSLVDAALLAPSAMNMQPWHLTVLTNPATILEWESDIIRHFVDLGDKNLVERNKERGNKIFYDAPAVFVISMKGDKGMDVGIMAQTITIAAKSMGLDSVILGFPRVVFDEKYKGKWAKKLGFPEDHIYGIAVAVGHAAEAGKDRKPDMSKVSYID